MEYKKAKSEVKLLLESLTEEERKTLRRENPFKQERNSLILALRNRGVPGNVIGRASGMSEQAVLRIASKGQDGSENIPIDIKKLMADLLDSLRALGSDK